MSFTQVEDEPYVWLSIRDKNSLKETQRLQVNHNHTLGRVDIQNISDNDYAISWIEQHDASYHIYVAIYDFAKKSIHTISQISIDESRKSGFPRMVVFENDLVLSFVDVKDEAFSVKIVRVALPIQGQE